METWCKGQNLWPDHLESQFDELGGINLCVNILLTLTDVLSNN